MNLQRDLVSIGNLDFDFLINDLTEILKDYIDAELYTEIIKYLGK
jgi:hypothetical protein